MIPQREYTITRNLQHIARLREKLKDTTLGRESHLTDLAKEQFDHIVNFGQSQIEGPLEQVLDMSKQWNAS